MIVVLLNGYPESGKDEVIDIAGKHFRVYRHSSIDTPKRMAQERGWDGKKNEKSRKMLVDLKKWWIEYFDGPFCEITNLIESLNNMGGFDIVFTQSREGEEIERIRHWCESQEIGFQYVFVDRDNDGDYGNTSDNNVLVGSQPDVFLYNNKDLDHLSNLVITLMSSFCKNKLD